MRALVTGGAGLIGSHTVDLLVERGYDVRIYDSLELPTHAAGKPAYLSSEAEFIQGDVRDREALERALVGVDVVLHLAATGGFTPRLADYVSANSLGTANLLELVRDRRLPVRRIVVASSIAVYGEGKYRCAEHGVTFPRLRGTTQMESGSWEVPCPVCGRALEPLPTDEDKPADPLTMYALSKYDQERMVMMFGRATGMPTVALRYFVTYGPRQSVHNPYTGVCTIFASRVANNLPMIVYEDGRQTRDFIFVKDVARANLLALEDPRFDFQVLNVGSGRATQLRDLASMLSTCLRTATEIQMPGRYRPDDVRHIVADTTRLSNLGFRPLTSPAEGLSQYVAWLSEQGPLPEYFSTAESELRAAGIVRSAKPAW